MYLSSIGLLLLAQGGVEWSLVPQSLILQAPGREVVGLNTGLRTLPRRRLHSELAKPRFIYSIAMNQMSTLEASYRRITADGTRKWSLQICRDRRHAQKTATHTRRMHTGLLF